MAVTTTPTTSNDIDRMIAELKAAGWTPQAPAIWRAPDGTLHLGPAGAWRTMKGVKSVIGQLDIKNGRQRLIQRAINLRVEIEQIFIDCASWNDNSKARKSGAEPIDPDPDGQLRRIADGLDRTLANEAQR